MSEFTSLVGPRCERKLTLPRWREGEVGVGDSESLRGGVRAVKAGEVGATEDAGGSDRVSQVLQRRRVCSNGQGVVFGVDSGGILDKM